MMKKIVVVLIFISACQVILPQTAIITDDVNYTTGAASSVLDIKSDTKGFLIPRLSLAERGQVSNPATGLMIYQTDNTPGFYYYSGSGWTAVAGSGSADGSETKVNPGTNITVSGSGTTGSPYLISYSSQSVTLAQRNAIVSPYAGQFVWCNNCGTAGEFQVYNGTVWTNMCGGTATPVYPTVTTTVVSSITQTTASSGGSVSANGGSAIALRGVCWSTTQNPTIGTYWTTDGSGNGSYGSSLTGLTAATTYYVRAYVITTDGTFYGNQVNFTTSPASVPTLTTNAVTNITETSARSGGNISSDGGAPVTAYGVCWSTTSNPTLADSYVNSGSGTGSFTSDFSGLTAGITYYLRAYATNSAGTAYGNQYSFTAILIGSNYQGGKVAYIFISGDIGYVEGETHGLIAAASDESADIRWFNGSNTTTNALGTAIGTGNQNTDRIVSSQGAGTYAARLCYDKGGSYTDWYLPSQQEMVKLTVFATAAAISLNTSEYYWSSTEYSSSEAFRVYGGSGTYYNIAKSTNTYSVRCLRTF